TFASCDVLFQFMTSIIRQLVINIENNILLYPFALHRSAFSSLVVRRWSLATGICWYDCVAVILRPKSLIELPHFCTCSPFSEPPRELCSGQRPTTHDQRRFIAYPPARR